MSVKLTEAQLMTLRALNRYPDGCLAEDIAFQLWRDRSFSGRARGRLRSLHNKGLAVSPTPGWWRPNDAGRAALNPTGEA